MALVIFEVFRGTLLANDLTQYNVILAIGVEYFME